MIESNITSKYTWSPALYNKSAPFVYSDKNTKPLFELLSARPGERIADMGCGTGELTLRLQKLVGEEGLILGVDASESMLKIAEENGIKNLLCCDIQMLEMPGKFEDLIGTFDAVFTNSTLQWCKQDPHGPVKSAKCLLKPGGRFVGEFPGYMTGIGTRCAFSQVLKKRGINPPDPWFLPQPAEYAKASILEAEGFEVEYITLDPRVCLLSGPMIDFLRAIYRIAFLKDMGDEEAEQILQEVADICLDLIIAGVPTHVKYLHYPRDVMIYYDVMGALSHALAEDLSNAAPGSHDAPPGTKIVVVSKKAQEGAQTIKSAVATPLVPDFSAKDYSTFFLAGALCCTITHGAMTPIDVVKTRIQVDPALAKHSLLSGGRKIVAAEGPRGLLTGFGPTAVGYLVQGGAKFAGYEFWKKKFVELAGSREEAVKHRTAIYLVGASVAEFFADILLTPLEATRIRLVSDRTYATGLVTGFTRMAREGGVAELYAGFLPILCKQIPYAIGQFTVNEWCHEVIFRSMSEDQKKSLSGPAKFSISLGSGVIAGFAAAILSHPADTLLSQINKGHGPKGSMASRLIALGKQAGFRGLFAGLGPRMIMTAGLVSGQFLIYGAIKDALNARPGVEIHKEEN
ncbi:Mitochondrial carrier, partial [Rhizoctonia solani]